ncbi:hypothetical protein J5N97_012271 [Dioscorea zingiberensis]|uniref:Ribosomal protein L15 n=1 Tax=Dioscorea zingiberensis TaxID=325984 RepID=A0A9D5CQR5_9LILI|nr:hypothetical protein J5N97_012271 [Dioscorea zingiberensis]
MWRRLSLLSSKLPIRRHAPIPNPLLPLPKTIAFLAPPPLPNAFISSSPFSQMAAMGSSAATVSLLRLNDLRDNKGARKQKTRKGRGLGRGRGRRQEGGIRDRRLGQRAKEAVEAAGGSVRKVYYNKLGFRALLKPSGLRRRVVYYQKHARPPPKQQDKVDSIGASCSDKANSFSLLILNKENTAATPTTS